MALPGPLLETLVKLIRDAFNKNTLTELVRFKLGADMYKEWVPEGHPFKTDVFNLITRLDQDGLLAFFVDHLIVARADLQTQLTEIRTAMGTKVTSSSDQVEAIKTGVEGVANKLQLAPVRQIVKQSQVVLVELTAKFELLRAYKSLHDALHNAKMNFRRLESSARQMAADPQKALDFGEAVMSMETLPPAIDAAIQDLPEAPASTRQDESDWLGRFSTAITVARQAADAADPAAASGDARQSVRDISSILITEPSRIDGRLSRTADEIDLSKLKDVFSSIAALPELAAEAAMMETGRGASEQLLRQLKAQINQHARWQSIDRRLSGADGIMHLASVDEPWDFDGLWKALKEDITALMAVEPQSEWAKKISSINSRVDALRSASDWAKLPLEFNRFRQEATVQFFVVDSRLKTLAGEVNVIGTPLRNLLNQI